MQLPPPSLHLPTVETLDGIVDVLHSIIDWSIEAASPVGYFAVMYQRATLAIRDAIHRGVFEDGPRTIRFGVTYARRYFDAVQSYFGGDGDPPQVWQVTFETNNSDEPIMLQHMLTAMNAHVTFDFGVTAADTAGDSLEPLRNDFDAVNAILASQANVIAEAMEQLSPGFGRFRRQSAGDGIGLFSAELRQSRDLAWSFAQQLLNEPKSSRSKIIDDHDTIFAWWIRRHLNPPPPISAWVKAIAQEESRDTAHNIRVLSQVASRPC